MDGLVRFLDALQRVRDEVVDGQLAGEVLVDEARDVRACGCTLDAPCKSDNDRYAIRTRPSGSRRRRQPSKFCSKGPTRLLDHRAREVVGGLSECRLRAQLRKASDGRRVCNGVVGLM